jgi:uncharacterized membrane protein
LQQRLLSLLFLLFVAAYEQQRVQLGLLPTVLVALAVAAFVATFVAPTATLVIALVAFCCSSVCCHFCSCFLLLRMTCSSSL